MEKATIVKDAAELVQAALSPAPSAAFSLFRVGEDGERYEFPVRIQLLRAEDTQEALQKAQEVAQKRKEAGDYKDIYTEEQAVQLISRALVRDEQGEREDGSRYWRRVFVNADHLRKAFTEVEIAYCLNLYEVTKAKYAILRRFDPAELDEYAKRLSDQMLGPYFLAQLDSTQWPQLLLSLAQRVRDLSETLSLEQTDSPNSSESESETSDSGTTGSTGSPNGSLRDDKSVTIPDGHLVDKDEAAAIAAKIRAKASDDDDK